jgi:hypothetical protein
VSQFVSLLLPIAQSKNAPKCLPDVIMSLCVTYGQLLKLSRPFFMCSVTPSVHTAVTASIYSTFKRGDSENASSEVLLNHDDTSLTFMSPSFFTNGRSIGMMLGVIRPSIVSLEPYMKRLREIKTLLSATGVTSAAPIIGNAHLLAKKAASSLDFAQVSRSSSHSLAALIDVEIDDNKSAGGRSSFHSFHAQGFSKPMTPTPSLYGGLNSGNTINLVPDNLSLISEDIR